MTLDGQGSSDPDNGPQALTFTWRLVSKPATSQLTNAAITDAQTATPSLTPDVVGSYVLELEVFDGALNAFDNVMIEVRGIEDVTALVRVTTANEKSTLDRRTRKVTSTADLTLTNISQETILVPIQAVFIPSVAEVGMPEATGRTSQGQPFYDVGAKATIVELKPNQAVTFGIKFEYTSTIRFTYQVKVLGVRQGGTK